MTRLILLFFICISEIWAQCTSPCIAHDHGVGTNTITVGGAGLTITGATLLVANVSYYDATTVTPSDHCGNSWTAITVNRVDHTVFNTLYYVLAPTICANETFTSTGTGVYQAVEFAAFNRPTNYRTTANANSTSSSFLVGPVTTVNGDLVIATLSATSTITVSSLTGGVIIDQDANSNGNNFGGALGFGIASGTSTSMTWVMNNDPNGSSQLFSFYGGTNLVVPRRIVTF